MPPSRQDRLAQIYDKEIHPLFGQRFDRLLLDAAVLGPKSTVLHLGCGGGALTAALCQTLDAGSRIIALDSSPTLLDLARIKVGAEAGKRVFLRSHDQGAKLPFAEGHFDAVLAYMPWNDLPEPAAAAAELARVTKPGGRVVVTTPLRGTWREVLDLYHEVLQHRGHDAGLQALAAYMEALPEGETVARQLEEVGLAPVTAELDHWELLFKSGREMFFAPVIEHGPLPGWKAIAGRGEEMQDVFLDIKDAVDTYFSGRAFSVGVFAGSFAALKRRAPGRR